jgi:protein gp37
MGEETKISYVSHTFNPWWGCVKISAGCKNCYAEDQAARSHDGLWGENSSRRFFGEKHWNEPLKWNKSAQERNVKERVLCGSMCDIMEEREGQLNYELDRERRKLYALIEKTPNLIWCLFTKRPENYMRFLPEKWLEKPLKNVWLFTTIEDKNVLKNRLLALVETPAYKRGLSIEPLLEDLSGDFLRYLEKYGGTKIDWVIVGGESGENSRPFYSKWAVGIKIACDVLRIPFFMKQFGSNPIDVQFEDKKGANFNEFPPFFKVRNIPIVKEDCGLYEKYRVYRNDGKDRKGGEKENAQYFVLDYVNDPFAKIALKAYAEVCKEKYPLLYEDLISKLNED